MEKTRLKKTPIEEIKEIYRSLEKQEKRLQEKSVKYLRKLLKTIAPKGQAVNIDALDAEEYDLYGIGITLYDKHCFYETGLPCEIRQTDDITIECEGVESDETDIITFGNMDPWSQYYLTEMVSRVEKNLRCGKLVAKTDDKQVIIYYGDESE